MAHTSFEVKDGVGNPMNGKGNRCALAALGDKRAKLALGGTGSATE
jgi:hypothetical protein